MSDQAIYAECARLASGAGAGALARVARRRGSLPMSATAKMLITAGGARMGTVGGGCLEGEIVERATQVMERREPAVTHHTLTSELAGDYGLTCGGTATMVIEPVYVDATLAAVYAACAGLLARGERGVLVTALDWTDGVGKLLLAGGASVGTARAALEAAARAADAGVETSLLTAEALVEPMVGAPRLIVFGGGHVGARVAQAAAFTGFRVTVVDDRPEYADATRLPFAERTVVCDFHDLPSTLGIDAECYVVVATRGHQHDALVMEQLARVPTRYLGMLGSRRKVAITWRLLLARGVDESRLRTIHAPVGLSLGADTPEEIAISVVAEMVSVRRAGSRRRGGRPEADVAR